MPTRLLRRVAFALAAATLPLPSAAQDAASLVADRVEIRADNVLVAEGAVEVLSQGMRLQARRITFDSAANSLVIEGPIVMTDASGTRLLADQGELSADLQNGILTGARLVLDQQLQIAADEMQRIGGRYTELGRSVASSCQVCAANPVPLWEIRAKRVVHDEVAQQLFFENAQVRFAGVPVFFIPRLRMPDPGLKRVTGFLTPDIRTTSELGTGINLPYFITLGDSRDLTVTPYVSSKQGRSLALRYRQVFRTGQIEVNGALSSDNIQPDKTRGYIFANGSFAMPDDFTLTFGIQGVSDNAYLLDYGISDQDRLDSFVASERVRRDEYILGRAHYFESLRDEDDNSTLPSTVIDLVWVRRFQAPVIGGTAALRYQASARNRTSSDSGDTNGDGVADGRDTARALVRLDWRRDWVLPAGLIGTALGELQADVTAVRQDPTYPDEIGRVHGVVGAELRWPLVKAEAGGATQVLEPVLQVVLAPDNGEEVPNEDSLLVEFDEGNLFAVDRFPGSDAVELGNRASLGLAWTRYGAGGSTLGFAFGKVLRTNDLDQFSLSSGLDGRQSDWLIGMRVATPGGLSLTQRLLLNDDLSATVAEARLNWVTQDLSVSSGYYWSIADPAVNQPDPISELTVAGSWHVADNWTSRAGLRHDFIAGRASRASLGLEYRNECLLVDLSLSRWFADSTSVTPTTEFGLAVDLLGFGGSAAPGPARRCRS